MHKKIKHTPAKSVTNRLSMIQSESLGNIDLSTAKKPASPRESTHELHPRIDSAHDSNNTESQMLKYHQPPAKHMTVKESVLYKLRLNGMSTEGLEPPQKEKRASLDPITKI